jgi:hypothetical protein
MNQGALIMVIVISALMGLYIGKRKGDKKYRNPQFE